MSRKNNFALIIGIVLTAISFIGFMTPSGSPGAKSGSPGDGGQTCTSCHAGTATSVNGWITSNIPVSGYVPGTTYAITVTGTHTGVVLFGFEATAENAAGAKVGTFTITNSTQTKLINSNQAVTHKQAGTTPTGSSKTWSFNWTAPSPGVGTVTFYSALLAANGNGGTSGDVVYKTNLAVNQQVPNSPPVFVSTPLTSATVGIPYLYNVEVTDPDAGTIISIAAIITPTAWLTLTPTGNGTATLTGDPANAPAGQTVVVISASDGVNPPVLQTFDIQVIPNSAPTFSSSPITQVTEGFPYSYTVTAEDLNVGTTLSLSFPVLPSWLSATGAGIIIGTPGATEVGMHNVSIEVTDGFNPSVFQNFTIEVLPNEAPVFNSTPIDNALTGTLYTYNIEGTDPNTGTNLTIIATTLPSWLSYNSTGNGTGTLSGTPTLANVGIANVSLELSDGYNPSVIQNISIIVTSTEGYSETMKPEVVSLYPNPGKGWFEVSGNNIQGIRIMDASGKQILMSVANNSGEKSIKINAETLPSGLLLIEIQSNNNKIIEKWINE
jgi:hypothetical protein